MRVVREQMAADGDLPRRAAEVADLLLAVTRSLDEPWQNRAAARDTVQQTAALHDHVNPYLGEHDAELAGSLLQLRQWGAVVPE